MRKLDSGLLNQPVVAAQVALAYAVMSDWPLEPLQVVVLHGLSEGMYASGDLFRYTARVQSICPVAVVGGDGRTTGGTVPQASWIGFEAVVQKLLQAGVDRQSIIELDPTTNSKEEAVAIVKMAKERGFSRVGSVSVAYHGGRMFPYMVAAMKELGYWLDYRMLPPARTDWWLPMVASQGAGTTNSIEATLLDAVKIERHIEQGFAASFPEVFYYLEHRAEIVRTQVWDYPNT
ncbi:MAG: hypothetical protein A2571_01415 [Candidatus Vogelbacteria bacterium RIFOXYD1_FULL_44_32]|uniref:DUF218 domain-containing protein n=1 Tax=Candidatus Vogelbacteria bacterium RIFOXYD1_FULL_44_32 TaxID=1802438 RepID=A0A1G2QCX2_9BACT|nr:MAG: hypothetical protein A2571_01415 [Candidatus Vogelbacteria bacterium RIFOXYD1_FULL_44_32]